MKQSGQSGRGQLILLCYPTNLIGFTLCQHFEIFLNIYLRLLFLAMASSIIHFPCSSVFFKPLSWRNVSMYQLVRNEWLSRASHPLSLSLPNHSLQLLTSAQIWCGFFGGVCVAVWIEMKESCWLCTFLCPDSSLVFLWFTSEPTLLTAYTLVRVEKKAPARLRNLEIETHFHCLTVIYVSTFLSVTLSLLFRNSLKQIKRKRQR